MKLIARAALCAALVLTAAPAGAEDEPLTFDIAVDPELAGTGVMKHLLVRFRLKTRRAGTVLAPGEAADLSLARRGDIPAIARGDALWRLTALTDNPAAARFADWLTGDIGRATLEAFRPRSGPPFAAPDPAAIEVEEVAFDGDPALGRRLADAHCGRCHVTSPGRGARSIGSTPSFAALRALPDWAERFMAFYALRPHPAIMQVEGVTPPFDPSRPPPMVPIEITLEEAEHIQAYAATVEAADLGAPVAAR